MITDQEVVANVAANVVRLLDARGWVQAELARATGVTTFTISRIVRGTTTPSGIALAKIAEAFDVSVDRLIGPPPRLFSKISELQPKSA